MRNMHNKSRESGNQNCVAFHIMMRNGIAIENPNKNSGSYLPQLQRILPATARRNRSERAKTSNLFILKQKGQLWTLIIFNWRTFQTEQINWLKNLILSKLFFYCLHTEEFQKVYKTYDHFPCFWSAGIPQSFCFMNIPTMEEKWIMTSFRFRRSPPSEWNNGAVTPLTNR